MNWKAAEYKKTEKVLELLSKADSTYSNPGAATKSQYLTRAIMILLTWCEELERRSKNG